MYGKLNDEGKKIDRLQYSSTQTVNLVRQQSEVSTF